jgi:DNA modification methylase
MAMDKFQERIIRVERRRVGDVLQNSTNPKLHGQLQNERLTAVLDKFGKAGVLLTYRGADGRERLFDGHARQGLNDNEMWFIAETDLNEHEVRELVLLYDPLAGLSDWREELVIETVQDLKISQDDDVLAEMLKEIAQEAGMETAESGGADTEPQVDKAEELGQKWGTAVGQLWQIGEHRLVCGDCTDAAVVELVMGGERAEIAFTSPPHLDMRDYSGNDLSLDILLKFVYPLTEYSNYAVVNLGLKFHNSFVVEYWNDYITEFANNGFGLLAWNIWDKTQAGSVAHATNMFFLVHEWLFVFGQDRKKLNRTIPNNMDAYCRRHGDDILHSGTITKVRQKDGTIESSKSKAYSHHQLHSVIQQTPELGPIRENHPATMPIGLPESYIEAMTDEGQSVLDPFGGSGTTMIASHNLKRKCRMIEIDPGYCAVILQRMLYHTGIKGERVDGNE